MRPYIVDKRMSLITPAGLLTLGCNNCGSFLSFIHLRPVPDPLPIELQASCCAGVYTTSPAAPDGSFWQLIITVADLSNVSRLGKPKVVKSGS